MDSKTKMKTVDNLLVSMTKIISMLTNQGFFTFKEGAKVIKDISDKQYEWMKSNFSDTEIYEFMRSNYM